MHRYIKKRQKNYSFLTVSFHLELCLQINNIAGIVVFLLIEAMKNRPL